MSSLALTCTRQFRHTSISSLFRFSALTTNSKTNIGLLHKHRAPKLKVYQNRHVTSQANQSERPPRVASSESKKVKKPMSSSMKFYLAKKKQHDAFIASERSEFELGKKHLANMMGMDYDEMTQEDVDKAIDYLFPSGLYDPEARPKMKPPEEVNMSFGHN